MKNLVLVFMIVFLLVGGTASAGIVSITEENLGDYDYIFGDGIVDLVATNAVGTASDLSLKLIWPTNADDAGIKITDLGNPTINSIIGYSYWVNAPSGYNPSLKMYLDTTGNGHWDTEVKVRTTNSGHGGVWFNIDSSGTTIGFRIIPTLPASPYNLTHMSWSDFQALFGDAVVKDIEISHRWTTISTSKTTYLDDFNFGDTDYVFSYIPEPATLVLLGLGSLILMRKKY